MINAMRFLLIVSAMMALNTPSCWSFSSVSVSYFGTARTKIQRPTALWEKSTKEEVVNGDTHVDFDEADLRQELKDAEIVTITLENHKPMGCTVEESLAIQEDSSDAHPPVFVAKVTEGGNAEKAGLEAGDVIVAVTGIFGKVSSVSGMGLEHVKSLVAGLSRDKPLELVVARGTDVMAEHETALVDLCTMPTSSDKQIDECVTNIHAMAYFDEDDEEEDIEESENEEDMLESVFDLWAEDMPAPTTTAKEPEQAPIEEKKPAPWSARSSPSGTYVRDPTTGEMRNIDA